MPDEKGRSLLADVSGAAARFGESFVSLLRRDEMERWLVAHGFDRVTHFGRADAVIRYLGGTFLGMPDVQQCASRTQGYGDGVTSGGAPVAIDDGSITAPGPRGIA